MSELDTDSRQHDPGFGHGGVPWYLMILYIGFLVFFTWYTLEYQLPDYLEKGPDALKPTAEVAK